MAVWISSEEVSGSAPQLFRCRVPLPTRVGWNEILINDMHSDYCFQRYLGGITATMNYYYITVINYYLTHSYQAADLKPKPDSCSTTLLWHLRFAVNLSSVGQRVAMLKLASGVGTA